MHLTAKDVAVDHKVPPSLLCLTIKWSKTDPFWKELNLYLGRTSTDLCPVVAVCSYLQKRHVGPGPLWSTTYQREVHSSPPRLSPLCWCGWQEVLQPQFLHRCDYCSCLRVEDSVIKTLGRWVSLVYVKITRADLAGYTCRLEKWQCM